MDLQLDYWVSTESNSNLSAISSNISSLSSNAGSDRDRFEKGFQGSSSYKKSDAGSKSDAKRSFGGDAKNSIKTSIKFMLIHRQANPMVVANGALDSGAGNQAFSMQYWVKEKKQKGKLKD